MTVRWGFFTGAGQPVGPRSRRVWSGRIRMVASRRVRPTVPSGHKGERYANPVARDCAVRLLAPSPRACVTVHPFGRGGRSRCTRVRRLRSFVPSRQFEPGPFPRTPGAVEDGGSEEGTEGSPPPRAGGRRRAVRDRVAAVLQHVDIA